MLLAVAVAAVLLTGIVVLAWAVVGRLHVRGNRLGEHVYSSSVRRVDVSGTSDSVGGAVVQSLNNTITSVSVECMNVNANVSGLRFSSGVSVF